MYKSFFPFSGKTRRLRRNISVDRPFYIMYNEQSAAFSASDFFNCGAEGTSPAVE